MKKTLLPGIVLAVLLAAWMYVVGFTGWYKHPTMQAMFWFVVLIQIVVLTCVIRGAARAGSGFAGRFLRGAGTSAVAAPLVFLNSLLFTQVVFPGYFGEIRAAQESLLRSKGLPEAEITEALKVAASMENPYLHAAFGAIGTIVTGIVVSLIVAAVVKKGASK
ncbi:MAG: DUF4199 domain-containing protein [Candidatus Brocadiae bacterium]|nr:DUF4199 domain-containing protein [Candidatus Brocadiia bacterium]